MASPVIVNSQLDLENYPIAEDILYWADPLNMQSGTFFYVPAAGPFVNDYGIKFPAYLPTGPGPVSQVGYWQRQFEGEILPQWFGIPNDGSFISAMPALLNNWMDACIAFKKAVYFPEGKYCFPVNFEKAFGNFDLTIKGVKGKSIITTYDTPNPFSTNFAIPAKIDLTKPPPVDGIYQIDVIGPAATINAAYSSPTLIKVLDNYIQILGGVVSNISHADVKTLGYLTEFDVLAGPGVDTLEDGLYVVAKHPFLDNKYGGGFAHFNLNGDAGVVRYNTGGLPVLYVQGTILKNKAGAWSRYYSGGAGFSTWGNLVVQDMIFDNVRFYLFSPFDVIAASPHVQTSDIFSITGCEFRNCNRIISSITYGTPGTPNDWFAFVYNKGGRFRFRHFVIKDNQFSFIHQCICWGPPPSMQSEINGNAIHDCYTMLTAFYLYMPTPDNTAPFWLGKISQVLTNNSFVRIRPLNSGANATTTLIRTTGTAIVNDNIFIDITQQAVYISSTDSTINGNSISKFLSNVGVNSPVILTKIVNNQGVVKISGNVVTAAQSTLVSLEGSASFRITDNSYVGCTQGRFITALTAELSTSKIYNVRDPQQFAILAGPNNYQTTPAIIPGNLVYYDKRQNLWVKLNSLETGYVISKVYNFPEGSSDQSFVIDDNSLIESQNITQLGHNNPDPSPFKFKLITVRNNTMFFTTVLHLGTRVTVEEYICSGNYVRNSSLTVGTGPVGVPPVVPALTYQIKSMFFENNKIAKGLGVVSLFAYQDLVFKNNVFYVDEDVSHSSYYEAFGYYVAPNYNPPTAYAVVLKGYTDSKVTIVGNYFLTIHSKYGPLLLDGPANAIIQNNIFDLNKFIYTWFNVNQRNAVILSPSGPMTILSFTENTIYPDPGKDNRILEFDTVNTIITSLTVSNNKVPINRTSITKTLLAVGKSISNYYLGKNFYDSYSDFPQPPAIPAIPIPVAPI